MMIFPDMYMPTIVPLWSLITNPHIKPINTTKRQKSSLRLSRKVN